MELAYRVVDVFTDRAFAGNPLAVVFDADGLRGDQMQALAQEFNLSETAFPVEVGPSGYRLRIFMPDRELPFAGHPSVGAAWVMVAEGRVGVDRPVTRVEQRCGAGDLTLRVDLDGALPGRVELTAGKPEAGPAEDPGATLAAVGLGPDDAGDGSFRVCTTGLRGAFLPVRREALGRMHADPAALQACATAGGWQTLSLVAWDPGQSLARVRVVAGGLGWREDPATGSGGSALGAWLAAEGHAGQGSTAYTIHQGTEMGRPSVLHGMVTVEEGCAVTCRIAGAVAPVAAGSILVPT